MKLTKPIYFLILLLISSCSSKLMYTSDWSGSRQWIGPDWWASPLQNWYMRSSRPHSFIEPRNTLCLLPVSIPSISNLPSNATQLTLSVELAYSLRNGVRSSRIPSGATAGFRIGVRGRLPDYRNALVDPTFYVDAVVTSSGALRVGSKKSQSSIPIDLKSGIPVILTLKAVRMGSFVTITLSGQQYGRNSIQVRKSVGLGAIVGSICLLSDRSAVKSTNRREKESRFSFSKFSAVGSLLRVYKGRTFGPILWSQYTMHKNLVRLQAQLAPFKKPVTVELWTRSLRDTVFVKRATAKSEALSRTVVFTVNKWNTRITQPYEVRMTWRGKIYKWNGVIRKEPKSMIFKLGAFSCDKSYLFPQSKLTAQVEKQNPDMLFFAGDQIYEDTGKFGVARLKNTQLAMLDFLRKVYQWGWTWRHVLKDRPSVILVDDHDVYQGNLWGHGGRRLPNFKNNTQWGDGGYLMQGDWLSAVEKVYTGHMPPSISQTKLPIGIVPYFTGIEYGGMSIAVLEDRKFKSGPDSINSKNRLKGIGADLLGAEQEKFLEDFLNNAPKDNVKMVLSQTPFSKISTHVGPQLSRSTFIYDGATWPRMPRDKVVKLFAKHSVLSVHGDQHLGMLFRQGVPGNRLSEISNIAVVVPGTANGFPRAWYPRGLGIDGRGVWNDDAGNPIRVYAVGNIQNKITGSIQVSKMDVLKEAYERASGYAIVEVDRINLLANVSMYRVGGLANEVFHGFPKQIALT